MKKINWEVAKEKIKGHLGSVGNSNVSEKFMNVGTKIVNTMRRKR